MGHLSKQAPLTECLGHGHCHVRRPGVSPSPGLELDSGRPPSQPVGPSRFQSWCPSQPGPCPGSLKSARALSLVALALSRVTEICPCLVSGPTRSHSRPSKRARVTGPSQPWWPCLCFGQPGLASGLLNQSETCLGSPQTAWALLSCLGTRLPEPTLGLV